MSTERRQFTAFSRLLHWTMAAMVLTMLCIGVAMVVSLADYHVLVSIHRPLGIAILILVVVRFVNRQLSSLPPFPATMSRTERLAATASELHDVWFDVRSPAGRLGNAVGSALSDCPLWVPASAFYPSARCHAVCGAAEGAHHPRLPLFPDVPRSLWGDFVSHADREGRNPEADGAMEHSATGGVGPYGGAGYSEVKLPGTGKAGAFHLHELTFLTAPLQRSRTRLSALAAQELPKH